MAIKDLATRISHTLAIGPATLSSSTTPSPIDLNGYQSAEVVIAVGTGGITFSSTNYINFVLQESDDGVNFSNVTASELDGAAAPLTVTNGVVPSLQSAHPNPTVMEFGYLGGKRYLELQAVFGGTHATGTPIAGFVVGGNPVKIPHP